MGPSSQNRTQQTESFLAITRAMSDHNRVRALLALRNRELCACQLTELLGLAPSTVSKHMSILKQARLVEDRKDGRWMFYRLPGNGTSAAIRQALDWAANSLAHTSEILDDTRRLNEIMQQTVDGKCRK